MKNFSFFKGLIIGSIFSALFWVGVFQAFNNSTSSMESPLIDEAPTEKIVEVQARF